MIFDIKAPLHILFSGPALKATAACASLLAVYALLAWLAVQSKCATMDEPLHATSAYLSTFAGDYRVDSEDPPLWKYWAMLPHKASDLYVEREGQGWDWAVLQPRNQSIWAMFVLYQTSGIDGAAFLEHTRAMFLIVAIALGLTIAAWTYRLFGATAAIVATAVFSFDPTLLAHGALVKNDVSITLVMLLFMIAIYQAGRKLTVANAAAVSVLLGIGLVVKYSAVLQLPMLIAAMLVRVAVSDPWPVLRWNISRRVHRAVVAASLLIAALACSWLIVWACYRFRFDAGPHGERLDTASILTSTAENRFYLHEHRWPAAHEAAGWEASLPVRLSLFAEQHRLLPQAWIAGFLFTYSSALVRPAFLLGRIYDTGCWYYFPLAMVVKTPLTTIGLMISTMLWIAWRLMRKQIHYRQNIWRIAILAIPIILYGGSAIRSNLNIGIRHLLPIMPFIFIALGSAAAALQRARPRVFVGVALVLGTGLAVETFWAFPDYIQFFNVAAGGERGGLKLLGDSNLDWGQDLPAVVAWQQKHPAEPLYLMYFGRASSSAYGIQSLEFPDRPCVMAISATTLQGTYLEPGRKETFRALWDVQPREVLNGTIYLYRFPDDMPSPHVADDIRKLISDAQNKTPKRAG